MRKTLATAAILSLAALGALVPTTGAQASTACDTAWRNASSGYLYAYDLTNCSGLFGRSASNDSNWGDNSGPFQRNNDNAATSVLFKGTTGLAVKFYEGPGYSGGHLCLEASEAYADSLAGTTFSNGTPANDNISSHRWVPSTECGAFLD
ncbi:hypothetical protein OHA71_20915 [Streptomyces sp. NBC_00444]|uniref:hypothetical protein n=1 Tax=Streptomyces sp. NBC_00444 TaxID=2975744 RepID=UPI002E1F5A89